MPWCVEYIRVCASVHFSYIIMCMSICGSIYTNVFSHVCPSVCMCARARMVVCVSVCLFLSMHALYVCEIMRCARIVHLEY